MTQKPKLILMGGTLNAGKRALLEAKIQELSKKTGFSFNEIEDLLGVFEEKEPIDVEAIKRQVIKLGSAPQKRFAEDRIPVTKSYSRNKHRK